MRASDERRREAQEEMAGNWGSEGRVYKSVERVETGTGVREALSLGESGEGLRVRVE